MATVTNPQEHPDFDLDEDLFDFAGVRAETEADEPDEDLEEIFASFRDPDLEKELDELARVPNTRATLEQESEAPTPEAPPVVPPPPVAPAATWTHVPATPPADQPPERPVAVAPAPARLSRGVVAIAAAVTVLNSALAIVVLGRRDAVGPFQAVTAGLEQESGTTDSRRPTPVHETELPDPDGLGVIHSHPVLDEARAQISRGEYASARQRVYGLLAIIDRLEDPRRSALEADCQYLIAQSLHLEALARMGASQ